MTSDSDIVDMGRESGLRSAAGGFAVRAASAALTESACCCVALGFGATLRGLMGAGRREGGVLGDGAFCLVDDEALVLWYFDGLLWPGDGRACGLELAPCWATGGRDPAPVGGGGAGRWARRPF